MFTKATNRLEVEENVSEYIELLERHPGYNRKLRIDMVYLNLSIFDWWNDYLSLTQLKQMKAFLKTAGELGYNGYVCFKVGAKYCAHGMWAHKEQSSDGYSPDGECLYHSFRSGDNYWDCQLPDSQWMSEKHMADSELGFTLKEVKAELGA